MLTASDVGVVDGLFAVELDFGAGVWDGGERYLEVYRQVIAESARDATTAEPAIRSAGQVPSIVSRLSPVRTLPDRPRHRGRPDLAG